MRKICVLAVAALNIFIFPYNFMNTLNISLQWQVTIALTVYSRYERITVEHTIQVYSTCFHTLNSTSFILCSSGDTRDKLYFFVSKITNLKAVLDNFNQMWCLVNF